MLCLHGEGLLSKSKCGLEVTPMSHEDIEHQAEFRVIVECAAVRLVAKRLTPEYSERLQEEVARQAVLLHEQNWRAILESDLYFHELLLNATQNPFLMRLSGSIALGLHYCGTERDNYATVDEHREILEAVIAGDADLAVRLMHLHIDSPSAVDARLATPPIHRDEQSDA
jgi:DNA-binding GntR family transcriptional regulator